MRREASSSPPYEGGNWEGGVEASVGTGPGAVLESAESGPEYNMAGTLGVSPASGPVLVSIASLSLTPSLLCNGRHLALDQYPIRSRLQHWSALWEATRHSQGSSNSGAKKT